MNKIHAVQKITTRHYLLNRAIGTRSEEDESYQTSQTLQIYITFSIVLLSILEMLFYFAYNNLVSFVRIIIILNVNHFSSIHGSKL